MVQFSLVAYILGVGNSKMYTYREKNRHTPGKVSHFDLPEPQRMSFKSGYYSEDRLTCYGMVLVKLRRLCRIQHLFINSDVQCSVFHSERFPVKSKYFGWLNSQIGITYNSTAGFESLLKKYK